MKSNSNAVGIVWVVMVVLSWFALWMMCPEMSGFAESAGKKPGHGTKFYYKATGVSGVSGLPTDMILPSPYGMGRDPSEEGQDDWKIGPVRFNAARFLEEKPMFLPRGYCTTQGVPYFARMGSSFSLFSGKSPFVAATGHAAGIRMEIDSSLTNRNFRLPDTAHEVLSSAISGPWEVRAWVEIGLDGMVEHVFIRDPSDKPAANESALQMLYRGKGNRDKAGGSGYVRLWMP